MAMQTADPHVAEIPTTTDYSLTGESSKRAVEYGLAEADWYTTPLPRETMRALLERRDGPAIRDTLLLVALLLGTGWATVALWGTWWVILPYAIYAVLYGTSSDSRWHECGHGTAFKTGWMNTVVYEVASFMVMRESTLWRWSHNRHHSDTIVVGRDPEITLPRPPKLRNLAMAPFATGVYQGHYKSLFLHASGRMTDGEKTFVPEAEWPKVYRTARIYLAIIAAVIVAALLLQSWIPIFLFIIPHFFGTWLMIVHNVPQHAGLAENVLDHRLNCRTIYMNPISRFIYWNMNYHVEHHMFPLVPYHALPRLHEMVKHDYPAPYPNILSSWREILPTLIRQQKEPGYHIKRTLPPAQPDAAATPCSIEAAPDADGWVTLFPADRLPREEAMRVDHARRTYALFRDADGTLYATDGICTHGNTHLGDGLVIDGTVECPKHNGRFHLADGSPARAPICRGLRTYPVEERDGQIVLNVNQPGGSGVRDVETLELRVVSNKNVSTFIKELVLEPVNGAAALDVTPGDYLQLDIPNYGRIAFRDFAIPEPYASVWEGHRLFELEAVHPGDERRNNYSIANNPPADKCLCFNVRIAMPPPGQDAPPGVGSAYVFGLQAGDTVTAVGPFGDFHIKPTQKEMVYIGGGAGMAPLRAHLVHLLENEMTARRISYWYGARSKQELYYEDYFEGLAEAHSNFRFEVALSEPLEADAWQGHTGFIHEVVQAEYLAQHPRLQAVEFYLCGPPQMVKACTEMLHSLGVTDEQIAFDEF